MKIDPSDPAFARPYTELNQGSPGLPIRLHLAAMAMQGLLANNEYGMNNSGRQIAEEAISTADALIAEYNRTEAKP